MKLNFRLLFLSLIAIAGAVLIIGLAQKKTDTPLDATLVPFFEHLFRPVKEVSIASSRLLPVNEMDEKEFGEKIALYYDVYADKTSKDYIYVNALLTELSLTSGSKPFYYRAFISNSRVPNAWAYPGGVIFVTEGLLAELENEAELVSILAHEMGHVEIGHCFQTIKYQLLTEKAEFAELGQLIDFLNHFFVSYTYSKDQESEADLFAYNAIRKTSYTPSAVAGAFFRLQRYEKLNGYENENKELDPVRDYFSSHPPLELRIERYNSESKKWWKAHSSKKRYKGIQNLNSRTQFKEKNWDSEWINKHEEYL